MGTKTWLARGAALAAVLALAPAVRSAEGARMEALKLSSPAFAHFGRIPARHTCDGADTSPPLRIDGVPKETKSLALVVDDPDAPRGTWVHWVVWNIDPATREIPEGGVPPKALQGRNDFGTLRYGGPCPPSGTHRYFFRLFALDAVLSLAPGAGKEALERAMAGHILGRAELVGLYARTRR